MKSITLKLQLMHSSSSLDVAFTNHSLQTGVSQTDMFSCLFSLGRTFFDI